MVVPWISDTVRMVFENSWNYRENEPSVDTARLAFCSKLETLASQVIFSQKHIVAVIAVRIHLFPFRTEKLSSLTPMVLPI